MKITLLGATGGLGTEILKQGLERGYSIKALVRTPDKVETKHDLLEMVRADVMKDSSDRLADILTGSDGIISALGTGMNLGITQLYSEGTSKLIEAVQQAQIRRFIVVSSSGTEPTTEEPWWYLWFVRRLLVNVYVDQARMEERIINTKDLDWVMVRPSQLTNGDSQKYRVRLRHNPEGGYKISRADVADFMLNQLEDNTYLYKMPALAY
ncbi:MAG: SDR family oxidoreductase [Pleurocapsa sp. MO_192.B19]|nr:SDR family oxidoreductase [Pleurocapsa sp. MO_192.B19]